MSYIDKEKALEFVLNNTPHINGETTMECVESNQGNSNGRCGRGREVQGLQAQRN